jgi:hypothetical protein
VKGTFRNSESLKVPFTAFGPAAALAGWTAGARWCCARRG